MCLRSLLPFRCIPFRAVATFIRSRSLHSIASSFHQPPQHEKQECCAPLPACAYPQHSANSNMRFFNRHYRYTQKIKKKAKVSGSPLAARLKCIFEKKSPPHPALSNKPAGICEVVFFSKKPCHPKASPLEIVAFFFLFFCPFFFLFSFGVGWCAKRSWMYVIFIK